MALTVAIEVDHLPSPCSYTTPHVSNHRRILLVPNVNPKGSVRSNLKKFIKENLAIPEDFQRISAPLFTLLHDQLGVEDIYHRYSCHCESESSDIHVDEESFEFFGRERGQQVELQDEDRLDRRHVIEQCRLHLKRLPQKLPEYGGRIYVELKNGIVPLQGISPRTTVAEIKKQLETMFSIPACQQLLSSVGRVMHDEFHMEDFDGLHTVYEDSILDLCKSGDTNLEQAHRRMAVQITIKDDREFTLVVQGRNSVRSVMQIIESRTGYAQWQQRLFFSGKPLDEKKMLADYFIFPDCTLDVNIFRSSKCLRKNAVNDLQEQSAEEERKPLARKLKFVRTLKGRVMGTLTIPVLTTDTILDIRKKIKRSLQPLVERSLSMNSPMKEPKHIDITPRSSPAGCLRSSSQSINSASPFAECQNKINTPNNFSATGCGSFTSESATKRLVSGMSPLTRQFSAPMNGTASAHKAQSGQCNILDARMVSARRLDFEKTDNGSLSSNEYDENVGVPDNKAERKGFGAWINNSVHALTDQIRSQLAEI